MYNRMSDSDRKRAIERGLISSKKELSKDDIPSKDRRYKLSWMYCGKEEVICKDKPWIYCKRTLDNKSTLIQYKSGKFEIIRTK